MACSTSSSVALAQLRRRSPVPVLGIVRPGAAAAARGDTVRPHRCHRDRDHRPLGVLPPGHRGRATRRRHPGPRARRPSCPSSKPGELDGPARAAVVRESLRSDPGHGPRSIDTLLLGCTHYPLLGAGHHRRRRARRRGHRPGGGHRGRAGRAARSRRLGGAARPAAAAIVLQTTGDVGRSSGRDHSACSVDRRRTVRQVALGAAVPDRVPVGHGRRQPDDQPGRGACRPCSARARVGQAAAVGVALGAGLAARYLARARHPDGLGRRRGLDDGARHRRPTAPLGAGQPAGRRAGRDGARVRTGHGPHRAAAGAAAGCRAAGCRGASRGRRPRGLGARQRDGLP